MKSTGCQQLKEASDAMHSFQQIAERYLAHGGGELLQRTLQQASAAATRARSTLLLQQHNAWRCAHELEEIVV